MAFIFSTSHLPETRVRRPDHLEDEEDDDVMQPMPRAGGVRAFSHLPQPVRAQADFSDPLSTRPATPVGRPRPHTEPDDDQDTSHAPEPDSDHDDEDAPAPQDHADDSPWHMPRITAQDLPPQAHPEDAHAPGLNNSTSSTRISGFSPSPQDLHDAFHSPTPDSPVGKDPVQDNRPALPRGRLFEKRGAPEAFLMQHLGKGASGPSSQQRLQGSQGAIAAQQQQVRGANPPAQGGRLIAQQQAPAQAQSPAAGPAQNAPAAPQPPATGMENQAQQHPYKINEADENAEFVLTDKATKLPFRKGVKFGEHARSIMNEELAYSPTAMKLLKMACSLSGKNVIIKKIPSGEAYNQIGPDGTITVFVNPDTLRPGTLSHEIAHSIQNWTLIQGMRGKTGIDGTQIKEAKEAGRKALNEIAPVMEKDDDLDDSKENEAMRASHIVKAEITAAEIRAQIDAMKKSDPDRYFSLIKNPAEVAKMFWEKQLEKEDAKHIDNKARIPKGTGYGLYDFEHVLKLLGHGVSWRHLTAMRVQRTKGW